MYKRFGLKTEIRRGTLGSIVDVRFSIQPWLDLDNCRTKPERVKDPCASSSRPRLIMSRFASPTHRQSCSILPGARSVAVTGPLIFQLRIAIGSNSERKTGNCLGCHSAKMSSIAALIQERRLAVVSVGWKAAEEMGNDLTSTRLGGRVWALLKRGSRPVPYGVPPVMLMFRFLEVRSSFPLVTSWWEPRTLPATWPLVLCVLRRICTVYSRLICRGYYCAQG